MDPWITWLRGILRSWDSRGHLGKRATAPAPRLRAKDRGNFDNGRGEKKEYSPEQYMAKLLGPPW